MNRRAALKQLSTVCGGIIATPIATAVLAGCRASGEASWQPKILSAGQNQLLTIIAERIIPRTDTPGAADAAVNRFIDVIVAEYFSQEQRDTFFKGLQDMQALCREINNKAFLDCTAPQQTALLQKLLEEAHSGSDKKTEAAGFSTLIRQFTIIGYYTSEIGATQELRQPPMGQYLSCIPFTEKSRAWAW